MFYVFICSIIFGHSNLKSLLDWRLLGTPNSFLESVVLWRNDGNEKGNNLLFDESLINFVDSQTGEKFWPEA